MADLQTAYQNESQDLQVLQDAVTSACATLDTGDGQSGSSLASRLAVLSGQVNDRIRDALHLGVKRAFSIVSSHYDGLNFDAISKGYILSDDEDEAKRKIAEFAKAVEVPGEALARLFEEDVGLPPAASSPVPEDSPADAPAGEP